MIAVGVSFQSGARLVQQLQEPVGREFNLLVAPLGGAVVAGDQSRSMKPAKVSVDKRVAGLRVITRTLGKSEMPLAVLLPGVRLEVIVLGCGIRLHVSPFTVQDVLTAFD